jgi:hypothetical protein
MVNPVSSTSVVAQAAIDQKAAQPKPNQSSTPAPKDTVQLSPEAKAQASGDVDHGGDSH